MLHNAFPANRRSRVRGRAFVAENSPPDRALCAANETVPLPAAGQPDDALTVRGLFCLIIAYPLQKTTKDAGKMCKITEKSSPAKPDWIFGLRMNQYLRLRAASAFFLRFTLGFS